MPRRNLSTKLDPTRRSRSADEFEKALRSKVIGQDQAIDKVIEVDVGALLE